MATSNFVSLLNRLRMVSIGSKGFQDCGESLLNSVDLAKPITAWLIPAVPLLSGRP